MAASRSKVVKFRGAEVRVERGQLVASVRYLVERWSASDKASHGMVQRFLQKLTDSSLILTQVYQKWYTPLTIITICNYDFYRTSSKKKVYQKWYTPLQKNDILNNCLSNVYDTNFRAVVDNLRYVKQEKKRSKRKEYYTTTTINNNLNSMFMKEEQEKEIYKEKEQESLDAIFKESAELKRMVIWREQMCYKYRLLGTDELDALIDEFARDCFCNGYEPHENINEAKRHFNAWLSIRISINEKRRRDDEIRQTDADRRRGAEAIATSAEDYSTKF